MKNYIIILFIIFLFWSCSEKEASLENSEQSTDLIVLTAAQMKQAGIVVDTVREEYISGTILLQGKVEAPPQNLISISVPLGGYLKSTDLLPGMKVQKGQRLALLEDPQYVQLQQDYLTGKIKLVQLESEFKRQTELFGQKAQSEKVYRQVEADYLAQKVMVKAWQEKLGLIGIDYRRLNDSSLSRTVALVSPVTGFVSKVNANIGKYIPAGDILFELVDVSDIHLALKIFEQDLQYVGIGQKLQAFTSFNPDKKYTGEIIAIGHSLDEEKSTMIHCHFQSYDPALVPGMYMRAEIETHPVNTLTLPESALILSGNKVWLAEAISDTVFQWIPVKKGVSQGDRVEVISDQDLRNRRWVTKGGGWIKLKKENKE
jgi:cobalt-zinc-cadmium efflux system membrane fusion protein